MLSDSLPAYQRFGKKNANAPLEIGPEFIFLDKRVLAVLDTMLLCRCTC